MMGFIGDKYGSRKALTISIFLMAFPTFAMGVSYVYLFAYLVYQLPVNINAKKHHYSIYSVFLDMQL